MVARRPRHLLGKSVSRFDRKAIFDEQVWSEVWLLTGRGFFLGNSVSKYDRKAVFDEQVWSEV